MNYANTNYSGMNHSNMNTSGMQGQRTGAAGKGPDFICKSRLSLIPIPTTPYQETNQVLQHSSWQTRTQIRWPKIQRSCQRCQKSRPEPENRQAHHDYCAQSAVSCSSFGLDFKKTADFSVVKSYPWCWRDCRWTSPRPVFTSSDGNKTPQLGACHC
jgi:hypothetical protein